MLGDLWYNILYNPLLQALLFLYRFTGNFGLAVIYLTVAIRGILVPVTIPALRSAKKMQDLKPRLDELKNLHANDKARLQKEQIKLYQEAGVNPASGCLPYLVQFLVLIALYQVFMFFISQGKIDGTVVNMKFLWLNLSKPDKSYVLPIVAGLTQFVLSLMMMPASLPPAVVVKNKIKNEEKKEDMATSINKQMMFMMPIMTVFIGISLPSGLALYWIITTVFSIIQQYFTTGPGGLKKYLAVINKKAL